jgi:RNA polymerase sigma-70 factor (ECF subfamily)
MMDMSSHRMASTSAETAAARDQDGCYLEAVREFGSALTRLTRGYESKHELQQDLLQEIHIALWRSFAIFDGRCSLRTWVYRVAHATATKHIIAHQRIRLQETYSLDEVPDIEDQQNQIKVADQQSSVRYLIKLIESLKPLDRQVILLYLEDLNAEAIGEIVGLSSHNIATKVHRIKRLLATMFEAQGKL